MADPWEQVNAYIAAANALPDAGPLDNGFGGVPDRDEFERRRAAVRTAREVQGFKSDVQREQDRQTDRQLRLDAQAQREADANAPRTLSDRLSDRRVTSAVRGLNDRLIKPASDRARRAPTPGGIGLMLFALIVFLFAIIAVNGTHTRLELIWLTLLGKTSVPRAPGDSNGTTAAVLQAAAVATAQDISAATGLPLGVSSAGVGAALGIGGLKVIGG